MMGTDSDIYHFCRWQVEQWRRSTGDYWQIHYAMAGLGRVFHVQVFRRGFPFIEVATGQDDQDTIVRKQNLESGEQERTNQNESLEETKR